MGASGVVVAIAGEYGPQQPEFKKKKKKSLSGTLHFLPTHFVSSKIGSAAKLDLVFAFPSS